MTSVAVPAALRRDRLRVAAVFLANGALFGSWVSRIPVVADDLALDEPALATALLGLATATILSLPLAGGLTTRVGVRRVTASGTVVAGLGLALVGTAGGVASLFALLFLYGAGSAGMDVAMNGQAVALERRYGRPIMVTFHGVWSLGGLLSTAVGGLTVAAGIATTTHLAVAAAALGVLGLVGSRTSAATEVDRRAERTPLLARPRGALWLLGAVALASAFSEGAIADWSGVYLSRVVGTDAATAAVAFTVFSAAMAASRFAGDAVLTRVGRRATVRAGGVLAGVGAVTLLLVPAVWTVVVGVALVGVGLAAVVPVAFSAAGDAGVAPEGEAVAAVATVGYAGFLAGPPLIGFLAHATSLRTALGVLVGAALVLVVGADRIPEATSPREAQASTGAASP